MARLPDLQLFAAEHGLKIGTIADLIEYRSRHETLVRRISSRPLRTAAGLFTAHAFTDSTSGGVHLALVCGAWNETDTVPARVHEPLSVLDALEVDRAMHSWSLDASLRHVAAAAGVSSGMVQHYFRTKDEMMAFALSVVRDRSQIRVTEAVARLGADPPPRLLLRTLIAALLPLAVGFTMIGWPPAARSTR